MRRSMPPEPYTLGNPMDSIISMRTKITRQSLKRIKQGIK